MDPIEDELFNKIKGFIVTGSQYKAYDTSIPWVTKAYDLFKRIIYPANQNVIKHFFFIYNSFLVASEI